jgi:hypothetical protein
MLMDKDLIYIVKINKYNIYLLGYIDKIKIIKNKYKLWV